MNHILAKIIAFALILLCQLSCRRANPRTMSEFMSGLDSIVIDLDFPSTGFERQSICIQKYNRASVRWSNFVSDGIISIRDRNLINNIIENVAWLYLTRLPMVCDSVYVGYIIEDIGLRMSISAYYKNRIIYKVQNQNIVENCGKDEYAFTRALKETIDSVAKIGAALNVLLGPIPRPNHWERASIFFKNDI